MAAVCYILDNLILSNWSPWVVLFHHCTKFGAKMLLDAELRAKIEIQDGGRSPSWSCYIIISDHPRSLFIGRHRPAKFYANPMPSFEDMTI